MRKLYLERSNPYLTEIRFKIYNKDWLGVKANELERLYNSSAVDLDCNANMVLYNNSNIDDFCKMHVLFKMADNGYFANPYFLGIDNKYLISKARERSIKSSNGRKWINSLFGDKE